VNIEKQANSTLIGRMAVLFALAAIGCSIAAGDNIVVTGTYTASGPGLGYNTYTNYLGFPGTSYVGYGGYNGYQASDGNNYTFENVTASGGTTGFFGFYPPAGNSSVAGPGGQGVAVGGNSSATFTGGNYTGGTGAGAVAQPQELAALAAGQGGDGLNFNGTSTTTVVINGGTFTGGDGGYNDGGDYPGYGGYDSVLGGGGNGVEASGGTLKITGGSFVGGATGSSFSTPNSWISETGRASGDGLSLFQLQFSDSGTPSVSVPLTANIYGGTFTGGPSGYFGPGYGIDIISGTVLVGGVPVSVPSGVVNLYGSNFAVNGTPVSYGIVNGTGMLSGLLADNSASTSFTYSGSLNLLPTPTVPSTSSSPFATFSSITSGTLVDPLSSDAAGHPSLANLTGSLGFSTTDGSVFTSISVPESGYGTFDVSVDGIDLGSFLYGQTVDFANYSSQLGSLLIDDPGVTSFQISGLNGMVDFPIQVDFNNASGSFQVTSVPEPTGLGLLVLGAMALRMRRRRSPRVCPLAQQPRRGNQISLIVFLLHQA
jgi:hypothetical protein